MTMEPFEVVSAFLDDEPFDPAELARALADPAGRQLLLDSVALRTLVRDEPIAPPARAADHVSRPKWIAVGFLAASVVFGAGAAWLLPPFLQERPAPLKSSRRRRRTSSRSKPAPTCADWRMSMRSLTPAVAFVVCSVALAAQQRGESGWTPVLQVRAVSSQPDGPRVGVAGEWKIVKDGGPLAMTFVAGPTLCRMGVGSGDNLPPDAGTSRVTWVVSGTWLGEQADRLQLRLTSKFLRLGGRESSVSTTQTVSLRDGDEITLDAVSEPLDGDCNVHTVTFNARLAMLPATVTLAQATYAADLWLIHNGPFDAEMRDHMVVNVNGLASVPFQFKPLGFSLPMADPRQGNISATISLAGSIRGRARADGLVDLDLETNRLVYGITSPETVPALTSMLRKTMTVRPGETTAVEFPPPSSGYSSVALEQPSGSGGVRAGADAATAAPPAQESAVQVVHGRLVLDTARFFRGHKTQLLITLKPLK
jgi:hypothetical protein